MKTTDNDYSGVINFFITVIGIVVISIVLRELEHIFIPFIIAYFMFFIFSPLNEYLKKRGIPSFVGIIIDLLIIIIIFWGVSFIIIDSFGRLGEQIPFYISRLNGIIRSAGSGLGDDGGFLRDFDLMKTLTKLDYAPVAEGFFSSTLSFFSALLFVLFFFVFIVLGHGKIYEAIKSRYVEKHSKNAPEQNSSDEKENTGIEKNPTEFLKETFKNITEQIQKYIITKFMINLFSGLLVGSILWIMGVDFYVVWGVMAFLLNFIPTIGSAIAVILPALMTLIEFESLGYTLLVALIIMGIQTVFGNMVEPKIFGRRLGLNPLVILLSLLLWGYIWGIVGMILSVPLTAVAKIIIQNSESVNMKFISQLMSD